MLKWSVGDTQIDFEAVADTVGYVAIGFSHGVKHGDEVTWDFEL